MGRHRATVVRPRWGRIALAAAAAVVTTTSLVGAAVQAGGSDGSVSVARDPAGAAEAAAGSPSADPSAVAAASPAPVDSAPVDPAPVEDTAVAQPDVSLPADAGEGKRVVFSEGRQRVWLVGPGGAVKRTYLVSGSIYDNLDPGTYEVYSRSEDAVGIDDSGTMQWFVRFTQGDNAAIGFHDIPVDDGEPVQTAAQLGTPLSHGCIRQEESDARALWAFAPLGTSVVVTA